jgi:hypothetical protein
VQATIGIIQSLLVCKHRGQLITNNSGSTHIHVWSRLARRAMQVGFFSLTFLSRIFL